MLELTWKDLNSEEMQRALYKLYNTTNLDGTTAARVDRIVEAAHQAMNWATKKQKQMVEKYCARDEKGQILTEEGKIKFLTPESEKEYQDEFKKMMEENKVQIKAKKLDWVHLQNLRTLSAADISILKVNFIDGIPEEI